MSHPDLDLLSKHLRKARLSGEKLTACCPFREEETPSFVVYASGGWNCLSCNERGNWRKLYAHLGIEIPKEERSTNPTSLVYEYCDETGACVGRVERIDLPDGGKTFRQYTLENGRWVKEKKYPLPFFNLPRIADAPAGSIVVVAEGEKCVEAVTSVGYLATCCSGGANGLKHADHSGFRHLRNKRVIVVPDNDDQGEAYAEAWLVECRKRRIDATIVRLKSTRKKYDVYDYLAEGGRIDDLISQAMEEFQVSREAQKLATDLAEIVEMLQSGGKVADLKRDALTRIASSASFSSGSESVTMSEAMLALAEEMREGITMSRIFTGIQSLDSITHGFRQRKQLIIVGGAPGAGKTALVGQLAEKWAAEVGPVHLTSAEMTAVELAERCALRRLRRPLEGPGAATYTDAQQLARDLADLPLTIQARAVTLDWLEADLRLWHAQNPGACAAIVDYLQILDRDAKEDDIRFIAEATRRLKRLAGELGIIILLLSQLTRSAREGSEPTLASFLGGTAIEANSDVAIILWNDGYTYVLKNRHGELGKAFTTFDKPFMTFTSRDPFEIDDGFECIPL